MGKDLYERSAAARAVFDRADAALGEELSQLCFEGPADALTLTANTQPAIVATSMAVLAALRERVGEAMPSCAAGHSLGEYSALCAAGAIAIEDAVRVCRARGQAMQQAVPQGEGAMAAVMGLADDVLEEVCAAAREGEGVLSAANFNAPGQTVIAGTAAAVRKAMDLAKDRGGRAMVLNVSAPFHCALMEPARRRVAEALASIDVARPAFDVLANIDAEPKCDGEAIKSALVRQVDSPVQWVKIIVAMRARGVTRVLEIGPGKVLAGLVKRIDKSLEIVSVSDAASLDKASELWKGAK
jgi:[acyl-carrier-protein] S-malonyltransferase